MLPMTTRSTTKQNSPADQSVEPDSAPVGVRKEDKGTNDRSGVFGRLLLGTDGVGLYLRATCRSDAARAVAPMSDHNTLVETERVMQSRVTSMHLDFESAHAVSSIYRAANAVRRM